MIHKPFPVHSAFQKCIYPQTSFFGVPVTSELPLSISLFSYLGSPLRSLHWVLAELDKPAQSTVTWLPSQAVQVALAQQLWLWEA